MPQGLIAGFPAPDFKTPSLPFSKSADESAGGPGPEDANVRSSTSTPTADAAVPHLFRPMSCRPQDEVGAHTRRSLAHQSFFQGGQFSFDSVASSLDDSGYYSSVSAEQNDAEGQQTAAAQRNAPFRPPTADGEIYKARNTKMPAVGSNPDFDPEFANPTKRIRPASPGNDEDIVLTRQNSRSHDVPKRPCVRRNPSRSHSTLPRATSLDNSSAGGTQTSTYPPNVPHPTAVIGGLPGLEFSEADLARYAELYEQGSERWSKATMEEWLAGANDIMARFTEMIDLVSLFIPLVAASVHGITDRVPDRFFIDQGTYEVCARLFPAFTPWYANALRTFVQIGISSKVSLYKSLQTRLADEHSTLLQRANELRDASQTLVRDSGSIGGGLDSNNIDARSY
jgi:hypothetical protein